jgi:hypothetical protein
MAYARAARERAPDFPQPRADLAELQMLMMELAMPADPFAKGQ